MEVYFIRHGQTDGNVARRHQHRDTALNKSGSVEAMVVAKKVKRLKATHLYTSTQMRAVETARAITMETKLIPETYPVFEELRRPNFFAGQRFSALVTFKYMFGWFFGFKDVSGHDGESYDDFLKRLNRARLQLENLPSDSKVLIVSHSVFINFFVAHLCHFKPLSTLAGLRLIYKIMTMKNTAIVQLRYQPAKNKSRCGWKVIGQSR